MDISDQDLLRLVKRDNSGALGLLYMRHSSRVRQFAMKLLHDEDDANDVAHDVFMALWLQRKELAEVASPKSFLLRMTQNAVFSLLRHRRIVEQYLATSAVAAEPATADVEERVAASDLLERVKLAIDAMPERRRTIFAMNRFDHLTYEEIAQRLAISRKTVEYHMSQAIAQLRKLSGQKPPG